MAKVQRLDDGDRSIEASKPTRSLDDVDDTIDLEEELDHINMIPSPEELRWGLLGREAFTNNLNEISGTIPITEYGKTKKTSSR